MSGDPRDEEIHRLRLQLEVLRETIALYGNSLLSAPMLHVHNLGDTAEFNQIAQAPDVVHVTSIELDVFWHNRVTKHVSIRSSGFGNLMVGNIDLSRCRLVLALLKTL